MERRNFLLGGLALLATVPQQVLAQGVRWRLLGQRTVRGTFSRDSIPVFRGSNPLSALSFRTRGGEVQISDIEVIFVRGRSERMPSRVTARAHSNSTPIMLRSRNQEIRRVEFTYRRPRNANRSSVTIELHGRR